MRYHKAGQVMFAYYRIRNAQYLFRRARIQRCRVLIQQKELWRVYGCHNKRKRLPLSAGKAANALVEPIFKPHAEHGYLFAEKLPVPLGNTAEPFPAARGKGKVFFNGHARRAAAHGVLKQPAYAVRALIFAHKRYVPPVKGYSAAVGYEASGDRVEQGGFSRAVCAYYCYKVAFFNVQTHAVKRAPRFRADGKGFCNVVYFKHWRCPPVCGFQACAL